MPSLREYNERLASMASMGRVTGTMKLVAGSHLHRVQSDLSKPEGFTRALFALADVVKQPRFAKHRFLQPPPEKDSKILVIVMSADRGLCGGFNTAVVRAVKEFHAKNEARAAKIDHLYVGQKAYGVLKSEFPGLSKVLPASSHPDVKDSDRVAKFVMRLFHWRFYDEVWLISNHFVNSMTNDCRTERLLPDARPPVPKVKAEPMPLPENIEPNDERLLENIVYLWLQLSIYYAMLHRQAAITNELTEIVSGAEALN